MLRGLGSYQLCILEMVLRPPWTASVQVGAQMMEEIHYTDFIMACMYNIPDSCQCNSDTPSVLFEHVCFLRAHAYFFKIFSAPNFSLPQRI